MKSLVSNQIGKSWIPFRDPLRLPPPYFITRFPDSHDSMLFRRPHLWNILPKSPVLLRHG
jgi:hypothetical protein